MCVYIYIYIYIYVHTDIYTCIPYIYIYIHTYIYPHVSREPLRPISNEDPDKSG